MHNIEVVKNQVAFASRREPAWHGLGQVINEAHMTWKEILEAAFLNDWNVRTIEVDKIVNRPVDSYYLADNNEVQQTFNFGKKAPLWVVRDNPYGTGQIDVLGQATNRYKVFSNEETFEFADTIVNGSNVENLSEFDKVSWETAGSIDEGRRIFGSLSIEREIAIDSNGANDRVKVYLLVTNSHDGSTKLTLLVTPVRVVCQNTLNFALKDAAQSFKIKHTQNMDGRIDEARHALELTDRYIKVFEKEATELHQTKVDDNKFLEIFDVIHGEKPKNDVKGSVKKWENKRETLMGLWRGPTQENISGTAWAALNAFTEHEQWNRGIRGNNVESFLQAGSGFDALVNEERNRIMSVVKTLTAV